MRKNHILAHKNKDNPSRSHTPTISKNNPTLIHPKQAQVLEQIQRNLNPSQQNSSRASNLNPIEYRNLETQNYFPGNTKMTANYKNSQTFKPTVNQFNHSPSNSSQFKSLHLPPRIDSIVTNMTIKDKVKAIDRNSGSLSSKVFTREIVQQEVYQYSPTYDYEMAEQQNGQMAESNAWAPQNDQQFLQGQMMRSQQNVGMPPQPPPPNMMGMGDMFHQMIAQGAANQQMNQMNQSNQMGGSMNFMNVGIPLPGMVDPMMMSMNQAQNQMNGSNFNPFTGQNFVQDAMPVPLPFQQPAPDQYNFMGASVNQGVPFQNQMMMSQNEMNNSLNFSQASNPPMQFNFNQNPNPNMFQQNMMQSNMMQSNMMQSQPPQGLAQQFAQSMQQGFPQVPQIPQINVNQPTMDLAGAMSNLFQMPPQTPNMMRFSLTRPLQQSQQNNLQTSAGNLNFANSLNQLINQGHQQQAQEQNYSYHRPPVDLITCVICKQTYDVNNTRDHVLKHKSFRLPAKNQLLEAALAGSAPQPKLVIPKPPIIRPIVQPEECILKPQGNTYVFERIHRLQGQNVQIVDDFPLPGGDFNLSQQYRSSLSNGITPLIPGTDTRDPNFFPNYYQPDTTYVEMHPFQEQFQPGHGMLTSQTTPSQIRNSLMRDTQIRNSQIRNSVMGNTMMGNSQNRNTMMGNSQPYLGQSSQLSDFSYNYLGDQIPQPPQTGVIAAQKMKVPRQVLAAWRG